MHEDLKGKTALITGAGKKTGIGYAIAERLASLGCNVVIADLGRPPDAASPVRTGTQRGDGGDRLRARRDASA